MGGLCQKLTHAPQQKLNDNEGRPVRRMAIVTATVDQRQHRTPHLMNVQLVVGATSSQTA
jgi:hypothetical protein